jgi:ElaB/YqjD/DUF883 family membrane-anchored ribosome-binding protein
MNKEAKTQRIATLLADLQSQLMDIQFLSERIEHTSGPAKQYYENEKRKESNKLEKIKAELQSLRGVH